MDIYRYSCLDCEPAVGLTAGMWVPFVWAVTLWAGWCLGYLCVTSLLGKLGIRFLCTDDVKGLWENMGLEGRESQTHMFSGAWKEECTWGVMPRPVCFIWALG